MLKVVSKEEGWNTQSPRRHRPSSMVDFVRENNLLNGAGGVVSG